MLKNIYLLICCIIFSNVSYAKEILNIAVASNFLLPMEKIAKLYEADNKNIQIKISSAASGLLTNQIKLGAPFHLFLSADTKFIEALQKEEKLASNSVYHFADGVLVLWMPDKDISNYTEQRIKDLLQQKNLNFAMAEASTAPFGRGAKEFIKNINIALNKNVIIGKNVEQTANYVKTKSVSAGFVSLSQVISTENKLNYWIVPKSKYSPIPQTIAIVKDNNKIEESKKFLYFFNTSVDVKNIIQLYGYSIIESKI